MLAPASLPSFAAILLRLNPIAISQVGPHICVFKTHVDVFDKWSDEYAAQLRQLAGKHGVWRGWAGVGCCAGCGEAWVESSLFGEQCILPFLHQPACALPPDTALPTHRLLSLHTCRLYDL